MKSHQGLQVHALVFPAPSRPCAARAALREQGLGAPLAPTSVSGQLCLCHCLDRLVSLAGDWVRASMYMPWFFRRPRDRAPPARRFASKGSAPPSLLHLFRASYVCGIAWTALVVWLGIGSGPPGACLGFSGALETARRPRGASRASSAPTFVSGQLCLWDCLVRLVGLAGDWVRASMCMPWFLQRPRDRAPPARRFPGKPGPTSVSGQLCLWDCLVRLVFPA